MSNNVSFLEIKTHKTKLLDDNSYRGDDVFCANKELTGCINQVLSQRDLFQKEFYQNKYLSKSDSETFNSKCIILLGMLSNLSDNQKKCFELFRNNSRDVDILTFDELQHKIIGLQSIMTKNLKHTKNT